MTKYRTSLSRISVLAYVVDMDGTFQCMYDQKNNPRSCGFYLPGIQQLRTAMPNVGHLPTITLPPGYKNNGLLLMLPNATMRATFVKAAVAESVKQNYLGYNIDWENNFDLSSGLLFFQELGNALHTHNMILTYDVTRLRTDLLANGVTRIDDMSTYGMTGEALKQKVQNNIGQIGAEKYCVGMEANGSKGKDVITDAKNLISIGATHVCVWEDMIQDISTNMWQGLEVFIANQ